MLPIGKGPLKPRVGVASLSSPLEVGADRAPGAAESLARVLAEAGCDVVPLGVVDTAEAAVAAGRKLAEGHVNAVALTPVCWCEDYLVLDMLEECAVPVLFWPLPGMETGALCGAQQTACFLSQLGAPCSLVFGEHGNAECLAEAMTFLRAAALKRRLRRARVGLAGHRVGGMTHTAPNEFALKKAIGPRVVHLDLPDLLDRARSASEDDAAGRWNDLLACVGSSRVSEADGVDSMKVYSAIREAVAEYGLDALTVGCYPHLMGRVCLAASLLADEGVPLACEGDVNGAVGMLMLQLLTGGPTHCTDWLDPLPDGSVVFTHCGSGSFSLAERREGIVIDSVRLMGQGACALFPAKPGPVTLLGLVPKGEGYQCAVLEGDALPTDMVFPGNPVRVDFGRPVKDVIAWIHAEGVGHHWMIGYGHVAAELRAWAKLAGPGLRLVEM